MVFGELTRTDLFTGGSREACVLASDTFSTVLQLPLSFRSISSSCRCFVSQIVERLVEVLFSSESLICPTAEFKIHIFAVCRCSTTNPKSGGCCGDVSPGVFEMWAWPISSSPSSYPPAVVKTWALLLRSRSFTSIFTSTTSRLYFSDDDLMLFLNYIAVSTQHPSILISSYSQSKSNHQTCACGVPRSTWRQDLKARRIRCSSSSWRRFQLLNFRNPSSPAHVACTQHQLNLVYSSCSYSSLSKLFEWLESLSPLSRPGRLDSKVLVFLFGTIVGFIPSLSSKAQHWSNPTRAIIKPISLFGRSLLKLENCSPLIFFSTKKVSQTSSCRDRERSFSSFLLFVDVIIFTKNPLHERYLSLGLKTSECIRFPNRVSSCVMVCLGPEDTTRIIPMRLEVVERSTSRFTVTISMSRKSEGRNALSMKLIASGSFRIFFDTLSSLVKLVSLSFLYFALKFSKRIDILC